MRFSLNNHCELFIDAIDKKGDQKLESNYCMNMVDNELINQNILDIQGPMY